jgi:hypothetical protein
MNDKIKVYTKAFNKAMYLLEQGVELEPKSAFKQTASDCGIPYGPEMGEFVKWAMEQLDDL